MFYVPEAPGNPGPNCYQTYPPAPASSFHWAAVFASCSRMRWICERVIGTELFTITIRTRLFA